jgi:hypothetical protein
VDHPLEAGRTAAESSTRSVISASPEAADALQNFVADCRQRLEIQATTEAEWLAAIFQPMADARVRLTRAQDALRLIDEAEEAGG